MRTASELRAEADQLRRSPLNTLSFHRVTDKAQTRWRLPTVTGDFRTDHAAGVRMAVELIEAGQRAMVRTRDNGVGVMVALTLQRMADASMRMGFLEVIGEALMACSTESLKDEMEARWRRSFLSASPYGFH